MILVPRPVRFPKSLAKGVAVTAANCALRDAAPGDYEAGIKKFNFRKGIYGTKGVKAALAMAQFGKCCFCEGDFSAHVAGDVEHFRPKGSVKSPTARLYPGYYWLAYEPTNLYFACPDCNEYRKGDWFPLLDESLRARSHHRSVATERNLILDPGGPTDPRDHIRFAGDFPVGLTIAGKETIRILKLDREPLNKRRRTLINRLRGDQETINTSPLKS